MYALDLPSHHKTDKFPEISLELYVDIINNFITYLGKKEIILCGHSLGGAIIQEFYFKYPNNITALILCATGSRLRVSPFIFNSLQRNYQEYLDYMEIIAFYSKTSDDIKKDCTEETLQTDSEITFSDFNICNNFNVLKKTERIDVPCLIICGKADKLTPVKFSLYFHEKIKNSELKIIKKAGHMVMLERPKQVNRVIEDFINSLIER
jgi:pimeloyl-ACP methyl ester carboxylesterase